MATLDKYGYRQYLRDKGFNDDDITYDQNTQSVMAKGKFFGNATPEADGSTYNTKNNLDSLYRSYQTQNMPSFQDRSGALLDQAQQKLSQPAKPFEYNAYADPLYQNALMAAQTGAATQQGNTLAKLRSMGQGKSSYSEGVAQQIGQQAVSDVNARVLPELTAQAYQRYLGEQQMNRQNFGDTLQLAGAYGNLGQQKLDNDFRQNNFDYGKQLDQRNFDYQAGRDQVGDARFDQQFQYGQQQDTIKNDQWNQQFQYGKQMDAARMQQQAEQFAASQGLDWARLNQQQQQFVADQAYRQQQASTQNAERDFDRGIETYKATGQMPAYMANYGIDVQGLSSPQYAADLNAMYELLASGQAKPQDLIKQIDDKVKIGAEPAEGGERMKQAIYKLYPNLDPANKKTTNENQMLSTSGENGFFNGDWLKRAAALGIWGLSRFAGQ